MSFPKVISSRKRRFDFEASVSDESENDLPVKVKKYNGTSSYLSHIVTARLSKLMTWISDLPVKDYFISAVRMGAVIPDPVVVDDDEDEDEISVISVQKAEATNNRKVLKTNPFANKWRGQNHLSSRAVPFRSEPDASESSRKGPNYSGVTVCPLSTSTPVNSMGNDFVRKSFNYLSFASNSHFQTHESINGAAAGDWEDSSRFHSQNNVPAVLKRHSKSVKRPQISNPDTDIEILLDTRERMITEADEIEILSEIPTNKQPVPVPRSARSPFSSVSAFNGKLIPEDSLSARRSSSSVCGSQSTKKSYTADELVRLQERAQYQLLLDKYIKGPHYHPAVKKPASRNVEVQVDLSDERVVINHFKKEVLKQPVDKFLQKYYKPCKLVRRDSESQLKQSSDKLSESKEDSDDELQIVEMKLPEYKPKYRSKPDFFSSEWIQELKETVNAETEETRKIVLEHERQLERYRKERAALHAAEMKKRGQMRLQGGIIIESQIDEEEEFPDLTPEMLDAIENALIPYPPDEPLCSHGGYKILRKDMDTLSGLNWLNDEIINFYLALIVDRSKLDNYPSAYAFNSFFYSSLKSKGYSSVRRWTRKVDIFAYDLLIVPLHLGMHWCLAVIDQKNKKIQYYDSMGSADDNALKSLRDYLIEESKDKKSELLDINAYSLEIMQDIPRQMNGSDCGMFTLKYAEYITRNAEITFTQNNMQYFRKRMVYEILTQQLL